MKETRTGGCGITPPRRFKLRTPPENGSGPVQARDDAEFLQHAGVDGRGLITLAGCNSLRN